MASINKRPDGVWRARYRDEAGREHSKHFARKVDAQRWLDHVTASVVTGNYVDPKAGKITFAAYFEQWSERQVWVPGTVLAMKLAVKSTTFSAMPMRSIRPSHVESWVKKMAADDLAPGTITTRFNNVRAVFRAARKDKIIGSDPAEGITLPRRRRAEAAMTIPTPADIGKIMTAADARFRPFIGLCAFAGLRLGEAAAVKVDDIDFLRRTLAVSRQVQRAGKDQVEIRAPKYGSERVVFLPEALVNMLAAHVENGVRPDGWLFVGAHDGPPHQNTVGYWWRKTLRDANAAIARDNELRRSTKTTEDIVEKPLSGIKLHDLRHFYASGLIAQSCDVVTVQRSLGHATASTTLNTYSHLWPTAEDRTRKAAQAMMAATFGNLADSVRTEAPKTGTDQGRHA
jgi:integrase